MTKIIKMKSKESANRNYRVNLFKIQLKIMKPLLIIILVSNMIFLTIIPFNVSSSNLNYPTNLKVNKDPITSSFPAFSMAIDDNGAIYIIWNDKVDDDDRFNNMLISKSIDGGWTFSDPVQINDEDGSVPQAAYASISTIGTGTVYIAWTDGRIEGGGIGDIYFDKSTDGGVTFGSDLKVNDRIDRGDDVTPSIAGDDAGNVFIVWEDTRNDAGDVYFSKLSEGSSNFSTNICVNDDPGAHQQSGAAMTVDEKGSIYVVWSDLRDYGGIYFSKSIDSGESFTKDVKVCANSVDFDSMKIIASDNNIYIVWHDEAEKNVYFVKSENNGISWSSVISLEGNPESNWKSKPTLAVDNLGIIYVVWSERKDTSYEIFIAKSDNNGEDWEININKDINTNKPYYVVVFTNNDNSPYLSWVDLGSEESWDIYFLQINPASLQNTSNDELNIDLFILSLIIILIIIIVSIAAFAATEFGRYSLIRIFVTPFYTKLKKEDVLKHNLRNLIVSHITSHPGNNFKAIQKTLRIGNGTLVYHLSVLERENYISSKKVGLYKRFYPKNFQINRIEFGTILHERNENIGENNYNTSKNIVNNNDIQERILCTIQSHPGITQKELGEILNHSSTGINYHVNIMADARVIRIVRDGKWTRCYIMDEN